MELPPSASPHRRYSDVVAARVPDDGSNTSSENPFDTSRLPNINFYENSQFHAPGAYTSEPEPTEKAWTEVRNKKPKKPLNSELNSEQSRTVREAEAGMTPADKNLIKKRNQMLHNDAHGQGSYEKHGESSHVRKGKGRDPNEWGNLDLSEGEKDPEAQAEALKTWNEVRDGQYKAGTAKDKQTGYVPHGESDRIRNLEDQVAVLKRLLEESRKKPEMAVPEPSISQRTKKHTTIGDKAPKLTSASVAPENPLRPSDQMGSRSFMGSVIKPTRPSQKRRVWQGPSDDDSSSSSSSSSYDEFSSSSNDGDEPHSRKTKKSKKHTKKPKCLLKPVPPEKYSGEINIQVYKKFIKDSLAYLKDGRVPEKRRVDILSRYLGGQAYTFYARSVDPSNERWDTKRFFDELFDYIFPVDFITHQCGKLESCMQQNKTVKQYTLELNELFALIDETSERTMVNKLWHGLRYTIEASLWTEGLNPETATWDEVVITASRLEQYEQVHRRREHENNNRSRHPSNQGSSPNPGPSKSRQRGNGPKQRGGKPFRSGNRFNSNSNQSRPKGNGADSNQHKPKLSNKQMDELQAAGKCFNCHEVGHVSRHCPKTNNVGGSGSRRPPGMGSAAIGVDLNEIEDLRVEADAPDVLETMSIGFISYDMSQLTMRDDDKALPKWKPPREVGDALVPW
ncbi:hypothetical protein HGRIS_007865 [Hohenbuehelia grisea]|uniref:CCHC-type domain-containing protein n=1 Tax=Hohenbuehelia grisea TaxID=104357 RepID=A0ABR3J6J1_9AGAR